MPSIYIIGSLPPNVKAFFWRWMRRRPSWFGRAEILKMTVLPHILYKLQTIPIHLPPSFYAAYKRMCRAFLWGSKAVRISWAKLVLPKSDGGIGLLDLQRYYWAVHLERVVNWQIHAQYKGWVHLEHLITGTELKSIPWLARKHLPSAVQSHPFVGATLLAFDKACGVHSISAKECSITPIRGNPEFPPGMDRTYLAVEWPYTEMQAKHFFSRDRFLHQRELAALS